MSPSNSQESSMNGHKPLRESIDAARGAARAGFEQARETGKSTFESARSGVNAALAETHLSDIDLDRVSQEIRRGAEYAERKAKEYTDTAIRYARENPVPVALGAIGIGLLVTGLLARRRTV